MTQPTPPIEFGGEPGEPIVARWKSASSTRTSSDDAALIRDLEAISPTSTEHRNLAEHARDWWPLAMRWALQSQVPQLPVAVVSPRDTAEVQRIVTVCAQHDVPITVT
ncbi:MAG: hypothetical protein ACKOIZ_11820, partial [Actinomycetota bacterium]